MRLVLRPLWWPPLIAALAWFALAWPLINRALRALEIGSSTRLMLVTLATVPVLGALRALVDARLARVIAAEAIRARTEGDDAPSSPAPELTAAEAPASSDEHRTEADVS